MVQSVQHVTLDIGVLNLSLGLGIELIFFLMKISEKISYYGKHASKSVFHYKTDQEVDKDSLSPCSASLPCTVVSTPQ